MKKLRLLLTENCNKHCKGCCNKDWDLSVLSIAKSFKGYGEILITGGEPMLYPDKIIECVGKIRNENPDVVIYLYTAYIQNIKMALSILNMVNGITLTLHHTYDVLGFEKFNHCLPANTFSTKSMRLNIFKDVRILEIDLKQWKIKDNMEWIKDCPLPEDEVFMRYE